MPRTKKTAAKKTSKKATAKAPAKVARKAAAKAAPVAQPKKARRYTDKQRARILKEAAKGKLTVAAVCQKHDVALATYYVWRRKAAEQGTELAQAA